MNVRPIPKELLADSLTLILPMASGAEEIPVRNVRVKRAEKLESYTGSAPADADVITVWADRVNSSRCDFPVGAKVRFGGALFEITELETFGVSGTHHCRFKARRTGG